MRRSTPTIRRRAPTLRWCPAREPPRPSTNSVYFGDVNAGTANAAGTITLADGGSWAALGYAVGQGIYIDAAATANPNGNGTTFNGNNYYTIAAIGSEAVSSGTYNSTTGLVTLTLARR